MLSTSALQGILKDVTYKSGWRFCIYEGEWEGPHLQINVTLPDPYTEKDVELCVHSMIPPMRDTHAFMRYLGWRLARIEVHEMREFLRYNGVTYFDPHAPFANEDRE